MVDTRQNAGRKLRTVGGLDGITKFGDFGAMMGEVDEVGNTKS